MDVPSNSYSAVRMLHQPMSAKSASAVAWPDCPCRDFLRAYLAAANEGAFFTAKLILNGVSVPSCCHLTFPLANLIEADGIHDLHACT